MIELPVKPATTEDSIHGMAMKAATRGSQEARSDRRYSFLQRIMLQHSHPPKLALDGLGAVLGAWLLWERKALAGLGLLIGLSVLGNIAAWRVDINALSETPLGKWMLVQAELPNVIIRTLGATVLACGVWLHSVSTMVIGTGLVLLARLTRRILKRA